MVIYNVYVFRCVHVKTTTASLRDVRYTLIIIY